MNPVTLVIGFIPLVLFTLLDGRIPVADAAAIAAAAALLIVATTLRRGTPVLPIVQAITLAAIATIAFTTDTATQTFLAGYGRGIASLVLAAYMLLTTPFAPFTATIARANVPREFWKTPQFISLNQRISATWGLAVLVMGLTHLLSTAIGDSLRPFPTLLLQWGPTIVVVIFALRYTRQTVADAHTTRSAAPQPPRAY